mmetsp:Transcript_55980/g.89110  ORF Transcript_55980/g.89110 Transcript_55980/m.89110 type:complete len:190 (+) Transcript_55980:38-607(+)
MDVDQSQETEDVIEDSQSSTSGSPLRRSSRLRNRRNSQSSNESGSDSNEEDAEEQENHDHSNHDQNHNHNQRADNDAASDIEFDENKNEVEEESDKEQEEEEEELEQIANANKMVEGQVLADTVPDGEDTLVYEEKHDLVVIEMTVIIVLIMICGVLFAGYRFLLSRREKRRENDYYNIDMSAQLLANN